MKRQSLRLINYRLSTHYKFLLSSFCIFIISSSFAQTYIGGKILYSIPQSVYAEKSTSSKASFAEPGYFLGAELNHYFKKHFGYGVGFDAGNNPVDIQAWEKVLTQLGEQNPELGSFDYEIFTIYGTFHSRLNLSKNLWIEASPKLGFLTMNFPARSYKNSLIDSIYEAPLFSEGGDGTGFLLGGEAAIYYQINKIRISYITDFIYSNPRFNYYDIYSSKYRFFNLSVSMIRPGITLLYEL